MFGHMIRTGSTGSVGSAVVNEFLRAGLRVRALVRNLEKGRCLSDVFLERYGPDVFEIVHAEDIVGSGVLREAMNCIYIRHFHVSSCLQVVVAD
ncbi:NAD dependent epimerase/dehydratase [Apiospora marii]|uniref:NAD dependent epimerase/dehydratase n=1 Tax=Apiospora marii TaxID=335849 RepID=A0ABR1T432_9PEZI